MNLKFWFYLFLLFLILSCTADRKLDNPTDKLQGFRCEGNDYYVDYICDDEKEYLDWAASYPKYRKLQDLTRDVLFNVMKETGDISGIFGGSMTPSGRGSSGSSSGAAATGFSAGLSGAWVSPSAASGGGA